jgi:hypothetical protein
MQQKELLYTELIYGISLFIYEYGSVDEYLFPNNSEGCTKHSHFFADLSVVPWFHNSARNSQEYSDTKN